MGHIHWLQVFPQCIYFGLILVCQFIQIYLQKWMSIAT